MKEPPQVERRDITIYECLEEVQMHGNNEEILIDYISPTKI